MKKFRICLLFFLITLLMEGQFASAKIEAPGNKSVSGNIVNVNLDIKKENKQELKLSQPVQQLDGKIFQSDEDKIMTAFQAQKQMDVEDIRMLWESTVEKNSVIKFALKKLAAPPEQRRVHSSVMAKSISALISGASLLPAFFGMDTVSSSAVAASGSLANRVIAAKTLPQNMPLSDTELLQLAKLVEDLQDRIIKNYYDYKSTIEALKVCRQNLILHNKNYADAIKLGNSIDMISTSALYDKDLYDELSLEQQIKVYRLDLERLAGTDTVSKLNLTKLVSYNTDKMTKNQKEAK